MIKYLLTVLFCLICSFAYAENGFLLSSPAIRHGNGAANTTSGYALAQKFTLESPGIIQITEIGIWSSTDQDPANITLAIWTHDPANDVPESIVPGSQITLQQTNTSMGKLSYVYPTPLEIPGNSIYWIGYYPTDNFLNRDVLTAPDGISCSPGWEGSIPNEDTWHSHSYKTTNMGIYAVYEPDIDATVEIHLVWDPNTEVDLAGYKVYYGNASRNDGGYAIPDFHDIVPVGTEEYILKDPADGIYYFSLTAFNTANIESAFSDEVWAVIPAFEPPYVEEGPIILDISSGPPPIHPYGMNDNTDRGIIHVDANKRYFQFDDGVSYVPVGLNNIELGLTNDNALIDAKMDKWAEHGINYLRIWVGLASDPEQTPGTWFTDKLERLDYAIQSARDRGIYICLCFHHDSTLWPTYYSWGWTEYHKYNSIFGGPATSVSYMKTVPLSSSPTAHWDTWNALVNRYQFFVDRWKAERSIFMWDLVNDSQKDSNWLNTMDDAVIAIDEYDHVMTLNNMVSYGSRNPGYYDAGCVRVYCEASTPEQDPEEMLKILDGRIRESLTNHDQPVYVGEWGMDWHKTEAKDPTMYLYERAFLHMTWGPAASGAAGSGHIWGMRDEPRLPTERHSLPTDVELDYLLAFSKFAKLVDWKNFNSVNVNNTVTTSASNIYKIACADANVMLIYLMHDDPAHLFNTVTTNVTVSAEAGLANQMYLIDWINIRKGTLLKQDSVSGSSFTVSVPPFNDGIFGYVRKTN